MANEAILVVDDSAEIMRTLRENIVVPPKYYVISADNGRSGLDVALSHQPNLIMPDIHLPLMEGVEVLTAPKLFLSSI